MQTKAIAPSRQLAAAAPIVDDERHGDLYTAFPKQRRTQISSTNPLEQLNKEVNRGADVVGIFPNEDSIARLIGVLMLEQTDEWVVGRRYMTMKTLAPISDDPVVGLWGVTA